MTMDSKPNIPSLFRTRLIAVVDDDYRVLEALDNLLQSSGHRTVLHTSAEAFLQSPERKHVDLLISDIGLTGASGIELVRSLQREGQRLPAILISGRAAAQYEADAKALGVALLAKPFDSGELLSILERSFGP